MSSSPDTPRIAIVGAGIAGITLAAILSRQKEAPHVEVFERDARDRDQGTGFDVKGKAQDALKQAGVWSQYPEFSRAGSSIMRFYEPESDQPRLVFATPKLLEWFMPPHPECNRQLMREALIESFGHPERVHFECKVTGIRSKGKQAELLGEDGDVLGCFDLVVDASGFSSVLRSYRVDEPQDESRFDRAYTGLSMVHGVIPDPDASCDPRVVEKMGQGTLLNLNRGRIFIMQRYGAAKEDHRTSIYYSQPFEKVTGLADQFDLPHSTRFISDQETLKRIKEWMKEDMKQLKYSPDYLSAVEACTSFALRPLLQHPHDVTFRESEIPLILIGDALHTMPPYSGSGGNFALKDALDLAQYLTSQQSHFELNKLRTMEKSFLERTKKTLQAADRRRDSVIQANAKRLRGEPPSRIPGGSVIFFIIAMVMTFIYRSELFLGLRQDDRKK